MLTLIIASFYFKASYVLSINLRVLYYSCSYMGAWLGHINLFRAVPYWVDISRAEAASTEV